MFTSVLRLIKYKCLSSAFIYTKRNLLQSNLAVEEYRVNRERFSGLSCTWYTHAGMNPVRLFHCSTSNATTLLGSKVCNFP
jgi:hypothetical protein